MWSQAEAADPSVVLGEPAGASALNLEIRALRPVKWRPRGPTAALSQGRAPERCRSIPPAFGVSVTLGSSTCRSQVRLSSLVMLSKAQGTRLNVA